MKHENNIETRLEQLARAIGSDDSFVQSVMSRLETSSDTVKKQKPIFVRRLIMKPFTKFAAAAAVVIVVFMSIDPFRSPTIAFGDVVKNTQNAKTISWKSTIIEKGQLPKISDVMILEPHNMRVETENNTIWILNYSIGKSLFLEPLKKVAVISSTEITSLDIYCAFKHFQQLDAFSIQEVGKKHIEGRLSAGFQLTNDNGGRVIMVWADAETGLPVLIEETRKDPQSSVEFLIITHDIVFDAHMDETLFDITPPEDYSILFMDGPVERSSQQASQVQAAANMDRILKKCLDFAEKNGGQWPDKLYDLVNYGLDQETFINPRLPDHQIGYVYLKPQRKVFPSDIVLHEAYDVWSSGINVGFADGHIEFIRMESDFINRLLE